MFAPEICLQALRTMREKFGLRICRRYGFVDAFNRNTRWVDSDVIGIDVGITLLSAENLRTGNIWRWFMGNPELGRAMRLAGLLRRSADPARRSDLYDGPIGMTGRTPGSPLPS